MSETETSTPAASRPSLVGRCFFKNAVVYRLPPNFNLSSAELEELLAKQPLTECGPLETERRGWVPGTPLNRIVHTINGQHLIALGIHSKILPGSVVRQETQKRAAELAEEQGFPVGRKQMRELKDKVAAELLAKALVKTTITRAWLDLVNGWVVVEAAGATRAEKLISTLRDTLGSFAATMLETEQPPSYAMATWLRTGDAPLRYSLDSDLELQSADTTKATVRYARHTLDGEDIQVHLNDGKIVTRLGLTWSDKISLVLTRNLELKKIAFLALEESEAPAETSVEEQFDADLLLMTADLAALLGDLMQALGGISSEETEAV
jgi:recombination associated protein RdgC